MISISAIFEFNKAEAMVGSGKLSKSSIDRLNKAKAIRTKEKILSGVDRGADEKLRKHLPDYTLKKTTMADIIGPTTNTGSKEITSSKRSGLPFRALTKLKSGHWISKKEHNDIAPVLKNHEVDEAIAFKKNDEIMKKHFNKHNIIRLGNNQSGVIDLQSDGVTVGRHASPEVLEKEKKIVDYLKNAHGTTNGFHRVRHATGEYDYVDSLKNQGSKVNKKLVKERANKLINGTYDALISKQDIGKTPISKRIKKINTGATAIQLAGLGYMVKKAIDHHTGTL